MPLLDTCKVAKLRPTKDEVVFVEQNFKILDLPTFFLLDP
jgi:hypothetical protein